jgi:hypothetical protein
MRLAYHLGLFFPKQIRKLRFMLEWLKWFDRHVRSLKAGAGYAYLAVAVITIFPEFKFLISYREPILWLIPLAVALLAYVAADRRAGE